RARAVLADLRLDDRLRRLGRLPLVRGRPAARDRPEQEGDALPAHLPLADPGSVGGARLPVAARLAGAAERRLRRRQPALPPQRAMALRRDVGEGLVHPRQLLADGAVLLPRLDGRAAVD